MSGSHLRQLRRTADRLSAFSDVFGEQINARTNVLDLPSHYPYSAERWRVFVDGSRVFPEYDSVSQYTHTGDTHELSPAAGETVIFESAERPRYVVSFELAVSFAFAINQSLQSGDSIKMGLYDGSDGWYVEQDGSHADDEADFVLERGGTEQYRVTDGIETPTTTFARLQLLTAWYDITRQEWSRSYSDDGEQVNRVVAEVSNDGQRGSKTANLPVHFEVTASASTTGLVFEAGSVALVNRGTADSLTRNKVAVTTETIDATDTYVPLFALRIDPDRDIINAKLSDIAIGEYSSSADVDAIAQACDPSKVLDTNGDPLTDSDFTVPDGLTATNNAIEISSAVEQFPDNTGTPQTATTDPGGFQVGEDAIFTGKGNTVTSVVSSGIQSKRPVYGRDVLVVAGRAGSTGDATVQFRTEQDW